MKTLSITEPYATLIKSGLKCIETRSWKTSFRGKILIHASATKNRAYLNNPDLQLVDELNFGNIICTAELVDCVLMTEEFCENLKKTNPIEYKTGFYSPGRYAWVLKNVQPIEPIKAKGHLGLWNYQEGESK